jgi:isochorismate synthase EntC
MKLLFSVLAMLLAGTDAQHHTDALDEHYIKTLKKDEKDRHPLIPDHNHVITKNSNFLLESFDELQKTLFRIHW